MYYVESTSNVQNNCTYSENQVVENMIPNDALQKPPMPVKIRGNQSFYQKTYKNNLI